MAALKVNSRPKYDSDAAEEAQSTPQSDAQPTSQTDQSSTTEQPPSDTQSKPHQLEEEEEKKEPDAISEKPIINRQALGVKNKVIIGSFDPHTFHYSFRTRADPLSLGMFPVFGYLRVPHLGVYGDAYEPTPLRALLELSVTPKLVANLPDALAAHVKRVRAELPSAAALSGFVAVHSSPRFAETQHFALSGVKNLVNVMLHAWLFSEVAQLSSEQQLESSAVCGLFAPRNVRQVRCDAQQVKSALDRGVPFGRLEERAVFLHGLRFSPCNLDVARDEHAGFCSFFLLSRTKDAARACLSYHVFANNADNDELLKAMLKQAGTVQQLLAVFEALRWGDVFENLSVLCRHY